MTKRLTNSQLEAIRKRAEAATEGPWTYVEDFDDKDTMPKFIAPEWAVMRFGDSATYYPTEGTPPSDEDADFIAHSREDIPALLAEVERLKSQMNDLERFSQDDLVWELVRRDEELEEIQND